MSTKFSAVEGCVSRGSAWFSCCAAHLRACIRSIDPGGADPCRGFRTFRRACERATL